MAIKVPCNVALIEYLPIHYKDVRGKRDGHNLELPYA